MPVQLGINPLTWTNDDLPSLGGDTPLEVCLSEGKQAGFAGFELGHKFPREADALNTVLAAHDLKAVSGWYSLMLLERSAEEEIEAMQSHLELLRDSGCKVMVCCEVTDCVHGDQSTPLSLRRPFPADKWEDYADKLNTVAAYALKHGVRLAYHHHMGTVIQTEEEIDELMRRTGPELGLLLDSGHCLFAGGDPAEVAKRWSDRICHVHCKDIRKHVMLDAKNRNLSFLDAVLNGVFTVPGDGCVDYPSIFSVLKEINYEGWLVVEAEQDPAVADPLTYASLGHRNLQALATEAGLM